MHTYWIYLSCNKILHNVYLRSISYRFCDILIYQLHGVPQFKWGSAPSSKFSAWMEDKMTLKQRRAEIKRSKPLERMTRKEKIAHDLQCRMDQKEAIEARDRSFLETSFRPEPEPELEPIPVITTSTAEVKPKRTNAQAAGRRRKSFHKGSMKQRMAIWKAESTNGKCCIKNCHAISMSINFCLSKSAKYCKKHALERSAKGHIVVDDLGASVEENIHSKGDMLLIFLKGWKYAKNPPSLREFYPGTPIRPTVFFNRELINFCHEFSVSGIATNRIWDIICARYNNDPPEKCYKQFLNVMTEVICWKTLDQNLIFTKTANPDRSDLDFTLNCPCCFGDKSNKKTIILVIQFILIF